MKRACDIILSITGFLVIAPLLAFAAILIKLDSKGPVFFKQERVGKVGKIFKIYKLRTMVENASTLGPSLTQKNDSRITRIGKILRWLKIDELPQLINILKGEMSFVGPRPEIPTIVDHYSEKERKVLSVRPGLVGPSQIQWRNEVEHYPESADSEKYYIEYILPVKLQADLNYIENLSFWKDLRLFFGGILATILGTLKAKSIFQGKRIT